MDLNVKSEPKSVRAFKMPKFCTGRSGDFSLGNSGFRPPLIKDRLDISEIFLKGSYIYFTFEPKSPSAPDMHADANADAHADAMGLA